MANEHPHALALPRHDRVGLRSTGPLGAAVCVVPCGATVTLARKSTGTPRIGRQHPRGYRTLGVGQLRLAHRPPVSAANTPAGTARWASVNSGWRIGTRPRAQVTSVDVPAFDGNPTSKGAFIVNGVLGGCAAY